MKKALLIFFLVLTTVFIGAFKLQETKKEIPLAIDKTPAGLLDVRDRLVAMLDPKDPNTIFNVVDKIQADPKLAINCHEIAHDIGHKAYELYGFSDAMTFDNPNHVKHVLVQNICAGGYIHGILEQMSMHTPDFLKEPEIICDAIPTENRASCFHGIGHVYMMANNMNATDSIKSCRVIKQKMDMYRCFEGVRMEQFWGSAAKEEEKPMDICVAAPDDEKPTCFLYSTFGYLRTHPKEYSAAAQFCVGNELPDSDVHFCLKGLGMTMMSKFKGKGMEASEQYVAGFSAEQKMAFYQGMTGYSRLSGVSEEAVKATCSLLKDDTDICIEALGKYK